MDLARNRLRKARYLALELLLSRLHPRKPLKILFSDEEGAKHLIQKGFSRTRHQVAFGKFTRDSVQEFDLLVPLTIADIDRLNGMRDLIVNNPLPIPSDECVRLCDDKTLFYEFLAANGFGDVTPRTDGAFTIPYLLKKRIDDTGRNSHFILSREREKEILSTVGEQDFFRQEIIPGRFEYASHVLFMGGRIVRSLSFEYEMREDGLVKGQEWPVEQRMIPCPFPDLFARILNAIEFEGLCCIDYKIHEERPYIMEVNPRFGGSLRLYFFSYVRHLQFQPEPESI